ncbi:MAG: DUF362 domain-containing protein [Chthoniobacterales bacterium]
MPRVANRSKFDSRALIVQNGAAEKSSLLRQALTASGFWPHLEQARRHAKIAAKNFRILIKPDLEIFRRGDPTGTDPELVEQLIDLLHDRGFRTVALGDAKNSSSLWLENREVAVLAELIGYRYATAKARAYDILDLSDDLATGPFPPESVLHGTPISRAWLEADYRINFAKNRTDEEFGFALCLQNLLGILPLRDKDLHYRHRLQAPEVCLELLRNVPAHFNLIDAFVSNHGSEGARTPHPLETRTIIASQDTLLADWAAALKMGLDPYTSAINATALRTVGLPERYEIAGDLAPYSGWINVPPMMLDSVKARNQSIASSRIVRPWLQSVDRELFPFKDLPNDRINLFFNRYFSQIDANPAAFSLLLAFNYLIGFAQQNLEALEINYAKERLRWRDAPLGFDPAAYSAADYEAVENYMRPLERIIRETPPEPNGLRWRYLDGSILFQFSHVVPVSFSKFCSRVEIAKAVQSMNDYIGGACVVVRRNRAGKVLYQAERNIYLPQPNWIAFFNGKYIDVGKLEYVEYQKNAQRIFWRTIKSTNQSADFDDGIVTFAAENVRQTRITIVARQKFSLPLFWQAVNIDLLPSLKRTLVVDAYTRYFRQTIANFEAQFQGREFRIGHAWNLQEGETEIDPEARLTILVDWLGKIGQALAGNFGDLSGLLRQFGLTPPNEIALEAQIDEEGFRHFPGRTATAPPVVLTNLFASAGREASGFFLDLADAIRKDIGAATKSG